MEKFNLIATAASGIEAIVGKELKEMGYDVQVENGRVRFEGTIEDIIKTNLWLRTADRVKIVVGEFDAYTFDELFEKTKALNWEDYLPMDAEFPVAGKSVRAKLFSISDSQALVKKAIVNKLSAFYHRQTRLPESGALYAIEVSNLKDHVMLTLDTTGPSLFKRGYRTEKGGAPMKENMAAALVKLTNWYPDKPFYDPVCGSGTIPIEAALIGYNIAPGLNRKFAFQDWDIVDPKLFLTLKSEAKSEANFDRPLRITGSDIDGSMIEIARRNALNAGLDEDLIAFKQIALKDIKLEGENGVMVANPPYGERLSDPTTVKTIYRQMGDIFLPATSWSKYILTSDLDFEKFYGEKATKRRKLYNGALRVDYFQFWGKRIKK